MRLTKKDIDYVRFDLKQRGVADHTLRDELVDHILCEVQIRMDRGLDFKTAYEQVINEVVGDDLVPTQQETFHVENSTAPMMLQNTFRMMFRSMRKHPAHTLMNIGGLAVGLCCFIVIALYVRHEWSFDRMFDRSKDTYRITMSSVVGGHSNHIPTSFPAIAPELAMRYPAIEKYVRVYNFKYSRLEPTFQFGDRVHYETKVIFADSTFFDLFNFPFLAGSPSMALRHPNSVVMTASAAKKYFGDEDPVGKMIKFNNRTELQVTGVLRDLPSNTHMQFDFLIPLGYFSAGNPRMLESWSMDWFWTYMIIPDPKQVATVEQGINLLASEKAPDNTKENKARFYLQPLEEVHLYSKFDYNTDLVQNGDIGSLYIFITVGVLVLFISAINFINISIAVAAGRFREIGISKVLGAMRAQLRWQFLMESVAVCLIALVVAFGLLLLALPLFSGLLAVPLEIYVVRDWWLLLSMVAFTVLTGLAAGSFPAFFVSSFEPQQVLKGVWKPGQGGARFRKMLLGIQIAIAIFLVVGTIVIFDQLRFIQNKSLGFEQDQVVLLTVRDTRLVKSYHAFKTNLLRETSIKSVSSVSEPIGREVQFMSFQVEGYDHPQFVKILNVTHDFVRTMGLEVVRGRDFSHDIATDSMYGFIINESAARTFGWGDGVGKAIDHEMRPDKKGRVIGVVKDFNFEPLQKQIDPIVIWFGGPYWYVAVNVEKGHAQDALVAMEREWKKIEPDKPFSFQFLDQAIQHVYEKDERLAKVFVVFAVLSIVTAMIGLYGLVSFVAGQRLAEVGIRKVMGASSSSILILLSKEYLILVLVGFMAALPATWWIMSQWLENYAYRIGLGATYFAVGLVVTGLLVLATVSIKAWKAARTNPVSVLRAE